MRGSAAGSSSRCCSYTVVVLVVVVAYRQHSRQLTKIVVASLTELSCNKHSTCWVSFILCVLCVSVSVLSLLLFRYLQCLQQQLVSLLDSLSK